MSHLKRCAYPAVIGAAIGGMLVATIGTILLFMYIIRNRNNNPRLHDMIFGLQHSQSRENINFPEDETIGEIEGDGGAGGEHSSQATEHSPRAVGLSPGSSTGPAAASASPASASQGPPTGDDDEPVNVTITVMATS
ncbi:hypothetical protein MATL_G00043000 [Megalops atlanticus]|uniref:Uncharacterized protein n=1 Tax=Megalops atlanticus TaxID=7932 RepID=A0A9D3QCP9_MEGAT|nr:hypothetical protein MATL_G00043000 [Megalops atlanticus]